MVLLIVSTRISVVAHTSGESMRVESRYHMLIAKKFPRQNILPFQNNHSRTAVTMANVGREYWLFSRLQKFWHLRSLVFLVFLEEKRSITPQEKVSSIQQAILYARNCTGQVKSYISSNWVSPRLWLKFSTRCVSKGTIKYSFRFLLALARYYHYV